MTFFVRAAALLAALWLTPAMAGPQLPGAAPAASAATPMKHAPAIAIGATLDQRGRLWTVREDQGQLYVAHSDDAGAQFSAPLAVLAEPEAVVADSEARPLIRVLGGDVVVLVWTLNRPEKKYAGDIRFARSGDGGKTWSRPRTLNDDGLLTGHRYPSITTDGHAKLAISWLDGRDREAAGGKEGGFKGSSIYTVESPNSGLFFDDNRKLADHTCECCRTAMSWSLGVPVAFWRNLFDVNTRDFALAYFDRRRQVERATDDNWKIDACPHHGGAIAVDRAGRLHMTWFTNGEKRQGLFYAHREAGKNSSPVALGNPDNQPGHADVAAHGQTVLVAWREFDGERYRVYAMRSDDGGSRFSAPQQIAATAGVADYPLALVGPGQALVVWKTLNENLRVLPVGAQGAAASASAAASARPAPDPSRLATVQRGDRP